MGLRRRRHGESELIELVRTELASVRTEIQATLAETAAILSVRVRTELEHRMGEPSALVTGIQGVRETITGRDAELVHVLNRVVAACDTLAERVQIDRIERSALVDAVNRLTIALGVAGPLSLPSTPLPTRETVIGGTVDPVQAQPSPAEAISARSEPIEPDPPHEIEIDLEAAARAAEPTNPPRSARPVRPDGVEVRCRFGDRWVTGFEVCEVIRLDDATRYRLRRRSDGSVIPTLFDEKDLRFFSTAFVDPP